MKQSTRSLVLVRDLLKIGRSAFTLCGKCCASLRSPWCLSSLRNGYSDWVEGNDVPPPLIGATSTYHCDLPIVAAKGQGAIYDPTPGSWCECLHSTSFINGKPSGRLRVSPLAWQKQSTHIKTVTHCNTASPPVTTCKPLCCCVSSSAALTF